MPTFSFGPFAEYRRFGRLCHPFYIYYLPILLSFTITSTAYYQQFYALNNGLVHIIVLHSET